MSKSIDFEKTILPCLGKTAKLAGFYFMDTLHENDCNLSKEQWLVLKKLYDKDGQNQNELAIITNRSKTSLTRLIHTMEKKGLVSRVISKKDRRKNHVYLSKEGKSMFLKSLPYLKVLIEDIQDGIDIKDLNKTIQVLNHIQENIQKKINAL